MKKEITFIEGTISVDDRGQLISCNDFDMKNIRRFYIVSNHEPRFIRAWHAHKRETKFVTVISGAAIVATVKINNWKSPGKKAKVHRYTLSDKKPGILAIPPGYANGFMNLTPDTKLMFLSDRTLEESKNDDFRYEARYWNPWDIIER